MTSLDQALTELADGDRTRFDAVYRQAWPRVRSLCERLMRGDPEADDIAQRALLAVFDRSHQYDPDRGSAMAWILGIAAWEVRTHRTRCARRREAPFPEHLVNPTDTEQDLVHRDLLDAIRLQMGTLSELDQQTLSAMLHHHQGGATYRKRLQRALERLRASWRATHGI